MTDEIKTDEAKPQEKPFESPPMPPLSPPMKKIAIEDGNQTTIIATPRYFVVTVDQHGHLNAIGCLLPSEIQSVAEQCAHHVQQIARQKKIVPANFMPKIARG